MFFLFLATRSLPSEFARLEAGSVPANELQSGLLSEQGLGIGV